MRELGRGGSLVAATIAALHNRTVDEKSRTVKSQSTCVPSKNVVRSIREDKNCDTLSRRTSGGSERPLSTASETSERDSASVQSSEDPPPQESGDSDSPDEATVKCTAWSEGAVAARSASSSDTESSSSNEEDSDEHEYETRSVNADYRTLTPSRRLDDSTRRDDDFKWMPTGNMLDEVDENLPEHGADDFSTASIERRKRTPSERRDRDRKSRSSLTAKPPQHPTSGRASSRSQRSRNEETPPDLQRRWNSYEHFRWPDGGWWPPMCWCHGPPVPPPCYMHDRNWPSNPSLPPGPVPNGPFPARGYKNDAEERVRRLEAEKESLQLQVQVLSEQIAAQTEKMTDLERALQDTRQRLEDSDQRLQKEMLQRSSLETQKLELLSKLSEVRLQAAARGVLERSPPPEGVVNAMPVARPVPPRTPPANYGRQIERNTHMYSSLPRSAVLTSDARVAFADREDANVSLRGRLESGVTRARSSTPRLRPAPWETTDIREWDCETTCGWLESMSLEVYVPNARVWLSSTNEKGVIAAASPSTIDKELGIKHPLHKKKIVLAITDLLGGHGDALLSAAGRLDAAWTLRWLEDVGVCSVRAAAADAALDARTLHRLTHHDLALQLRVSHALHALAIRRGIQVLRSTRFDPDTMVRRAAEGGARCGEQLARWSSHRVMQWLTDIDLAEYAPNLRGAGVHGGLMLLEPRFTAELLAALLNIPASKTLLRRHLTQRFNELLGRDVIQQKRNAEQTLGYQPLTATTKYKVPKKSQFSLKRKKSKDELDLADLVCPLHDDNSDDESKISNSGRRVGCLSPA